MKFPLLSLLGFIAISVILTSCSDSNSSEEVSYCLISDAQGKSIICTEMTGEVYTQEGCEDDLGYFEQGATASRPTECPEGNVLGTCDDYNDDAGISWEVTAYSVAGVTYCSDF